MSVHFRGKTVIVLFGFSCVFVAFNFSEVFSTLFKICFPSPVFFVLFYLCFILNCQHEVFFVRTLVFCPRPCLLRQNYCTLVFHFGFVNSNPLTSQLNFAPLFEILLHIFFQDLELFF